MKNVFLAVVLLLALQGCIRLTADAGYWHQNEEDVVKSKHVRLDTQELLPLSKAPGSIET